MLEIREESGEVQISEMRKAWADSKLKLKRILINPN